jgi:hypothetical protein
MGAVSATTSDHPLIEGWDAREQGQKRQTCHYSVGTLEWTAWIKGWHAGQNWDLTNTCPHVPGSYEWREWNKGYLAAIEADRRDLVEGLPSRGASPCPSAPQ